MSVSRWVLLTAIVAALIALQHFGLENTPEKREEAVFTNIADLPAGDMVPTYIGSLFLGSFRAVAIDVFWIQLKEAQDDRRYYLCREIAEMISKLQPHNEEVWAMLAWDFAYNVANGERTEEKAWQWVRYGILKLREGIRRNPRSPYLCYDLARFLVHKPTWQSGRLDLGLLRRIEADDEIQRELQDVPTATNRLTAFELALNWFQNTIARLEARTGGDLFKTQMGLYIHPDTMSGFMRDTLFFQGIYSWRLAQTSADSPDWDRSRDWFRRAAQHVLAMQQKYGTRGIDEGFLELYAHMEEVLEASRAYVRTLASSDLEARLAARMKYVREMEAVLAALGLAEQGHLWEPLSTAKRDLSRETIKIRDREYFFFDANEYNDGNMFATPLQSKVPAWGNLKPGPGDVDRFQIFVKPDADEHGHAGSQEKFEPKRVTISVTRLGRLPLRVRVYSQSDQLKAARDVPLSPEERTESFEFIADRPGSYFVDVRPLDEPARLPSDTRYGLVVTVEE